MRTPTESTNRLRISHTIQDVERPPFAEWWCYIRGITPTSPLTRKLEAMYTLRQLGVDAPAFLNHQNSGIYEVHNNEFYFSTKAITNSPNVERITWSMDGGKVTADIKFKNGKAFSHSEDNYQLPDKIRNSSIRKFRPDTDASTLYRIYVLRSFFKKDGFVEEL